MSYRDDLDAALMRADAAERETKLLRGDNERLAAELAEASEWLGGPRKRLFLGATVAVALAGAAIGGVAIGRMTAPDPVRVERRPEPAVPSVIGTMISEGGKLGRWVLTASRCVPRSDGIQLTAHGSEDHSIWLTNNVVEVETPNQDIFLEEKHCRARLGRLVDRIDDKPPTYSGHVELDCTFDDNRLIGRIEFRNCR